VGKEKLARHPRIKALPVGTGGPARQPNGNHEKLETHKDLTLVAGVKER